MASIEEKRSDFIPTSDDKCSNCKGHNGVNLSDRTKLLLLVLSISVLFFLGSLSAFRMNLSSSDPDRELMENYSRIQERLSSCHDFMRVCHCEVCEKGWTPHKGSCYFFSSIKQTWFESRRSCEALDAHLVIISSEEEQRFLNYEVSGSQSSEESHWIGLNDLDTEGRWVWVNNQTLDETGVEFWFKRQSEQSEPDNWKKEDPSGENCAHLFTSWFDCSCKYKFLFICENMTPKIGQILPCSR